MEWELDVPGYGRFTVSDEAAYKAVVSRHPGTTVVTRDAATAAASGLTTGVAVDATIPLIKWQNEQALAWMQLQNSQAQTGINAFSAQASAANTAQGNAMNFLGTAGNLYTSLRGPKNYGHWSSLMFGNKSGAISPMLAAMANLTGGLSYTPTRSRSALNWKSAGVPKLIDGLGLGGGGEGAAPPAYTDGFTSGGGSPSTTPAAASGTSGFTVPTIAGDQDPNSLQVGTANGTGPNVRNELGLGGGTGGIYTNAVPRIAAGSKEVSRGGMASRDDLLLGYYERGDGNKNGIGNPNRAMISYNIDPLDEEGNLIRPMWVKGQLVEPTGWDRNAWRYPLRNPRNATEEFAWAQYIRSGFSPDKYPSWARDEEDFQEWYDARTSGEAAPTGAEKGAGAADAAAKKLADPTQDAFYSARSVAGESAAEKQYREFYGKNPALLSAARDAAGHGAITNATPGLDANTGVEYTTVTYADGAKSNYNTVTGQPYAPNPTAPAAPESNAALQEIARLQEEQRVAQIAREAESLALAKGITEAGGSSSPATSSTSAASAKAAWTPGAGGSNPKPAAAADPGPVPVSRDNSKQYGSGSGNKPPPGYRAMGGMDPIFMAHGDDVTVPPPKSVRAANVDAGWSTIGSLNDQGKHVTDVDGRDPSSLGIIWESPVTTASPYAPFEYGSGNVNAPAYGSQYYGLPGSTAPAQSGASQQGGGQPQGGGGYVPSAGPTPEELDMAARWAALQWGTSKEEAYQELIGNGPDPTAAAAYLLAALGMIRAGAMAGLLDTNEPKGAAPAPEADVETGGGAPEPKTPPKEASKVTSESQADRDKRYSDTYANNPALARAAGRTGKEGMVISNAVAGQPIDGEATTVVTFANGSTQEYRTSDGAIITRGPTGGGRTDTAPLGRAAGGMDSAFQPGINLVTTPQTFMRNGQQFIVGEPDADNPDGADEIVANLEDRVVTWPLQGETPVPAEVARLANAIVPNDPYKATQGRLLNWQAEALERPGYTQGFRPIKMAGGGIGPLGTYVAPTIGQGIDPGAAGGTSGGSQEPWPVQITGTVPATMERAAPQGRWVKRADGSMAWASAPVVPMTPPRAPTAPGVYRPEDIDPETGRPWPGTPNPDTDYTNNKPWPGTADPIQARAMGGMDPLAAGGPGLGSMDPAMMGGGMPMDSAEGEMGIEEMPQEMPMESGEPNEQMLREFVAQQHAQGVPGCPSPDAPLEEIIAYVAQVAPELLDEAAMSPMSQGDLLKQGEPTSMSQGGDSWLRTRMPGLFARAMKKGGSAPVPPYADPAPPGNLGPGSVGNSNTLSGMGRVWQSAKPHNLDKLDESWQRHYGVKKPKVFGMPGVKMPKNWSGLPQEPMWVNDAGQVQAQTKRDEWKKVPQHENAPLTDPSQLLTTTAEQILSDPVLAEMISSQLAQRGESAESYWARANKFRMPSVAPVSLGLSGIV